MDFVSVFTLILVFLPIGQSNSQQTEQNSSSCYKICPAGYHKSGSCSDTAAPNRCEKCGDNRYTSINNTIRACLRCGTCGRFEVIIKNCSFNSDVVCGCKEGHYHEEGRKCTKCNCKSFKRPGDSRNCPSCLRKECAEVPECRRNCGLKSPSTTTVTSAATATTPATTCMTSTATATRATVSNGTSNPAVDLLPQLNQIPWLFLMGFIVAFLLLVWLLLFIKNKDLKPPAEDPIFNEQRSHQDSSPTTLTIQISEEMTTLCQSAATPEQPDHISLLLPDAEHKAEQTEQWPAIVLYAIIKEVPLRRWKEFLRLLSVADQQLERVELEAGLGLGSMERQYQMLRLWSQCSSANLSDVFSALHYMDLSGCAQLLQESLEKLQWRPEQKQGITDRRRHTDHDVNVAMQDT